MTLAAAETAALAALAAHLSQRREAVLHAWRAEIAADPTLTTGAALSRESQRAMPVSTTTTEM